jgi:divalent metal cation (Fe/Co/Zn/Cd) transporter
LLLWGRRWRPPALVAAGQHLVTDVFTSGGVLVGVALVSVTGWLALDSAVAGLVALPSDMLAHIKNVIGQHAAAAIEVHDVRTRSSGRMTFIELDLVVPGDIRVAEAHEICDRVEMALNADMSGNAVITIHVEPEVKAKFSGVPVL